MDNLERIRDELRSLPAYENRINGVLSRIQKAETKAAGLLRAYEAESRDVEKIQQESFSAFLLRLVGKYEDRLDKEQREELAAKLAYDEAVVDLEELRREERQVREQIDLLRQKARQYEAELAARKEDLRRRMSDPD